MLKKVAFKASTIAASVQLALRFYRHVTEQHAMHGLVEGDAVTIVGQARVVQQGVLAVKLAR